MATSGLLAGFCVSCFLFVASFVLYLLYARYLRKQYGNEDEELNTTQQIAHLKKETKTFLIPYEEIHFEKMIGKGSQGEVFRAQWRASTVAVKKIDTSKVSPEIIEEFCAEAKIMKRLRHPHLTLFMGVSLESPHLCILTEFVSRGSLFDIIHDEHSSLTWYKCLIIAVHIAKGMTYLHAHTPPILHRDLKSLNILVDENWRGKVCDFGMTRFQEDGTMTQCGSPLWMAPEMIKNEPYDEKSDVYSFAIILWEMYVRKIPYRDLGLSPSHLVVKVVKEGLRPPIPKSCPRAYKQLMERCWHANSEKRPTFAAILKTLEMFLQDPAILNHKPMSSREGTVVVRPEQIDDGPSLDPLLSHERVWRLDMKDVTFPDPSFVDIAQLDASLPAAKHHVRQKSNSHVPPPLLPSSSMSQLAISQGMHMSRYDSKSELDVATEQHSSEHAPPATSQKLALPPVRKESAPKPKNKRVSDINAAAAAAASLEHSRSGNSAPPPRRDSAKPSKQLKSTRQSLDESRSSNQAVPPSPSKSNVAPLLHNPNIRSTKEQKELDDPMSAGYFQFNQGPNTRMGKFRGTIVGVCSHPLDFKHLTMTGEERVIADLSGVRDTKLGALMKQMSNLRHPNIVLFMGAFLDAEKKTLNIVQEFMPRGTLHDILLNPSLIVDWSTMIQLLLDAAQGLAYLLGNRPNPVLHKDLSASRLLVDKNWRVKVSDYGFIELNDALATQPVLPQPTVFSAPEYIKSPTCSSLSAAANIYSFGMIMWQTACRRLPFGGGPLNKELIDQIVKCGNRPHLPNSLSLEFRQLIEKCWMADPQQRPSIQEVLLKLQKFKDEGPPKIPLILGQNAHKYRKSKTVFAYRSKDPITIMKDWGTNQGKQSCYIVFSGEDDVYCCDPDVFNATYERVRNPTRNIATIDEEGEKKSGAMDEQHHAKNNSAGDNFDDNYHEYRKTGYVLAGCMEEAFSVKTNGGIEHGMASDYLVQNEQHEQWSVEAKTFIDLYERWD